MRLLEKVGLSTKALLGTSAGLVILAPDAVWNDQWDCATRVEPPSRQLEAEAQSVLPSALARVVAAYAATAPVVPVRIRAFHLRKSRQKEGMHTKSLRAGLVGGRSEPSRREKR